jgi:hypothetical protein
MQVECVDGRPLQEKSPGLKGQAPSGKALNGVTTPSPRKHLNAVLPDNAPFSKILSKIH